MLTPRSGGGGNNGSSGNGSVPSPLVTLCLVTVQRLVTATTRRRTWSADKRALTHYLQAHIPHSLRQILQEWVLDDWRVYDTVTLRVLELLLSSATTSLRVTHVRTFYRDSFISLLPRLTGLQELNIQDHVWKLSERQLALTASALTRMNHLRVLTLQYCSHDLILAAVGAHCPHLQVLDVRGSRSVTDEGVWTLINVEDSGCSCTSRLGDAPPKQKITFKVRKCWGATLRLLNSKLLLSLKQPKSPQLMRIRSRSLDPFKWSGCCSSLTYVDLRCTRVTSVGVGLLTQALPPHARIAEDNSHIKDST